MKQIPKQTPITKSLVYNTIATGRDGMNEYLQVYLTPVNKVTNKWFQENLTLYELENYPFF